jgi:hypothetical protein
MEATNADDPYELVALVYAGFICEKCNTYEDGKQHEPGATWASMAQVAKDAGWLVEDITRTEGGHSWEDWTVLCPTCRSSHV